ncbi:MAG: NrfD/PsrC family molybdoenzyme membrane anchor subunit [Thermoanaerobaculia bacterium]
MTANATPIGGKLLTPGYKLVLALAGIGVAAIVYRFAAGLGAATAMNDGYPWGIWIAYDVVTGTSIACGGYAMAILVYIMNKGHYHPLIRPALVTSALGYTLAGVSVAIDVGRPWFLWRIPLEIWNWNTNSVLLEVAICIMAYTVVLWLELAPAILERWKAGDRPKLRSLAERSLPFLDRALIYIVALGVLLPTMHQSSLGSLMMLAGPRLHPLWFSPFLPLYFLITCIGMGYAIVVFEATASAKFFGTRIEKPLLVQLERIAAASGVLVVIMRFFDLEARGALAYAFRPTLVAFSFWAETLLFLGPAIMRLFGARFTDWQRLVGGGMLLVLGGAVYRFNVFLIGFYPGDGWRYFPSVTEVLVAGGLIAIEASVYIALVRKFPILSGAAARPTKPEKQTPAPTPAPVAAPAH